MKGGLATLSVAALTKPSLAYNPLISNYLAPLVSIPEAHAESTALFVTGSARLPFDEHGQVYPPPTFPTTIVNLGENLGIPATIMSWFQNLFINIMEIPPAPGFAPILYNIDSSDKSTFQVSLLPPGYQIALGLTGGAASFDSIALSIIAAGVAPESMWAHWIIPNIIISGPNFQSLTINLQHLANYFILQAASNGRVIDPSQIFTVGLDGLRAANNPIQAFPIPGSISVQTGGPFTWGIGNAVRSIENNFLPSSTANNPAQYALGGIFGPMVAIPNVNVPDLGAIIRAQIFADANNVARPISATGIVLPGQTGSAPINLTGDHSEVGFTFNNGNNFATSSGTFTSIDTRFSVPPTVYQTQSDSSYIDSYGSYVTYAPIGDPLTNAAVIIEDIQTDPYTP
jgi:hypothetical protein